MVKRPLPRHRRVEPRHRYALIAFIVLVFAIVIGLVLAALLFGPQPAVDEHQYHRVSDPVLGHRGD